MAMSGNGWKIVGTTNTQELLRMALRGSRAIAEVAYSVAAPGKIIRVSFAREHGLVVRYQTVTMEVDSEWPAPCDVARAELSMGAIVT